MIKYIDGRTIILCDRCGKEVINKSYTEDDLYGYEPGDYWLAIVRHSNTDIKFSMQEKNVLCYKCKGKYNKFFKVRYHSAQDEQNQSNNEQTSKKQRFKNNISRGCVGR